MGCLCPLAHKIVSVLGSTAGVPSKKGALAQKATDKNPKGAAASASSMAKASLKKPPVTGKPPSSGEDSDEEDNDDDEEDEDDSDFEDEEDDSDEEGKFQIIDFLADNI